MSYCRIHETNNCLECAIDWQTRQIISALRASCPLGGICKFDNPCKGGCQSKDAICHGSITFVKDAPPAPMSWGTAIVYGAIGAILAHLLMAFWRMMS